MRDDSERENLGGIERFGGFETGLRRAGGAQASAATASSYPCA